MKIKVVYAAFETQNGITKRRIKEVIGERCENSFIDGKGLLVETKDGTIEIEKKMIVKEREVE